MIYYCYIPKFFNFEKILWTDLVTKDIEEIKDNIKQITSNASIHFNTKTNKTIEHTLEILKSLGFVFGVCSNNPGPIINFYNLEIGDSGQRLRWIIHKEVRSNKYYKRGIKELQKIKKDDVYDLKLPKFKKEKKK